MEQNGNLPEQSHAISLYIFPEHNFSMPNYHLLLIIQQPGQLWGYYFTRLEIR